ncbi:MAG: single-stranded DNA-binding protein [Planctomycetes bacterium]|nr:single-stranded DNA-binding protein [Planctomycetota bacterium]
MASLNKVLLIGNLTRDPELRFTPQGAAVSEFSIAINRSYTSKTGERKEDVAFIDIVAWARQAELCAEYLKKGRPVFVEGRLTQDRWEQPDGQKRSRIRVTAERIQFLGSPGGARGPAAADAGEAPPPEALMEEPPPAEENTKF